MLVVFVILSDELNPRIKERTNHPLVSQIEAAAALDRDEREFHQLSPQIAERNTDDYSILV